MEGNLDVCVFRSVSMQSAWAIGIIRLLPTALAICYRRSDLLLIRWNAANQLLFEGDKACVDLPKCFGYFASTSFQKSAAGL